jgi:hypothetical protein
MRKKIEPYRVKKAIFVRWDALQAVAFMRESCCQEEDSEWGDG